MLSRRLCKWDVSYPCCSTVGTPQQQSREPKLRQALHELVGELRNSSHRFGCPHHWHETPSASLSTLRLSWRCRKQPPDLQQTGLGTSTCLCGAVAGYRSHDFKQLEARHRFLCDPGEVLVAAWLLHLLLFLVQLVDEQKTRIAVLSSRSSRPGARLSASRRRGRTLFAKHLPRRTPEQLTKGLHRSSTRRLKRVL